jgi:hypothetical protein
MAIEKFTRESCRLVAAKFEAAMRETAEKLGVSIRYRGGQFTEAVYTMKMEVGIIGRDGKPATREAESLRELGELLGIPNEKVGTVFTIDGVDYRLTGLRTRAGKYPLIAERTDDGRRFKFQTERVRQAMGLPPVFPRPWESRKA